MKIKLMEKKDRRKPINITNNLSLQKHSSSFQVIDEDATCISYLLLWYDLPTTQFSFCVPNLVEWFVLVQQCNDIAA
jgi:hypothetical protein